MTTIAIHRAVETQACHRADKPAVAARDRVLTYGELNTRANAAARELIACGLRRGGHALVVLERGPDLAVVLLAILKAGAAYTWHEPDVPTAPRGISVLVRSDGRDDQYVQVPIASVVGRDVRACPNLPVLTRPSDVAMVMDDTEGRILVPHATVLAAAQGRHPLNVAWPAAHDAFDLWIALMAGATITLPEGVAAAA